MDQALGAGWGALLAAFAPPAAAGRVLPHHCSVAARLTSPPFGPLHTLHCKGQWTGAAAFLCCHCWRPSAR